MNIYIFYIYLYFVYNYQFDLSASLLAGDTESLSLMSGTLDMADRDVEADIFSKKNHFFCVQHCRSVWIVLLPSLPALLFDPAHLLILDYSVPALLFSPALLLVSGCQSLPALLFGLHYY
jgi:hypothetical protein